MSVVSPIVKPFKLDSRFDDSDPKAKTPVNYMLEKLAIKKETLHKYLPADKFKREDGYIHGVRLTLKDKSSTLENTLNDIEKEIDADHEGYGDLSDDDEFEEVEEVCQEPEKSLCQLKQEARSSNEKVAIYYKNLYHITSKPTPKTRSRKEKIPEWHKDDIWEKYHGVCERVKCPICSSRYISSDSFHAGHILPESKGGMICEENIMPICGKCNSHMGSNHLYWFAWNFEQKVLWPIY